jgi:hypothetical protein
MKKKTCLSPVMDLSFPYVNGVAMKTTILKMLSACLYKCAAIAIKH